MIKILRTKKTRIQREKRLLIQKAALQVFSEFGLRGATLDKIAEACGLTKPNILYYYVSKDEIYKEVLQSLLEEWIRPLQDISEQGDPLTEILKYVQKKLRYLICKIRIPKKNVLIDGWKMMMMS